MDEGARKPRSDQQLAELLREGPGHGIHVLATIDTLASIERTLERQLLREFDFRVLLQMSAADSSTLIDSPAANKLGFHRGAALQRRGRHDGEVPPLWLPRAAELEALASRLGSRAHEPTAFPEPAAEADDKGAVADGAEEEASDDPLA